MEKTKLNLNDWLSNPKKLQELKDYAVSKMQTTEQFEKLPGLPIQKMQGSPENPQLIVCKALGNRRVVTIDRGTPDETTKCVTDVEVVVSECNDIPLGKYAFWESHKIVCDEMDAYFKQYAVNDSIESQVFGIVYLGELKPKKRGNRPAKLFRVVPT